jgi:hypothetical protein
MGAQDVELSSPPATAVSSDAVQPAPAPHGASGTDAAASSTSSAALLRERPVTLALLTTTLVFSYMDRQVRALHTAILSCPRGVEHTISCCMLR